MKRVYNHHDLLQYLNKLGVIGHRPIGWKQQDLCAMADRLIACAKGGIFPFTIHFFRKWSVTGGWKFSIGSDKNETVYQLPYDMRDNILTKKL